MVLQSERHSCILKNQNKSIYSLETYIYEGWTWSKDEKTWGLQTATEEAKQKTTGNGVRMESTFSCGYVATAFLWEQNDGRKYNESQLR